MQIKAEVLLEIQAAQKAAAQLERDIASTMQSATGDASQDFTRFASHAVKEMEKIRSKQEKVAADARGFVGDIGDAIGVAGTEIFGLSEAQSQAAEDAIYLTEKGAALGEVFGPLGALFGGLAGAVVGAAQAMSILDKESNEFGATLDSLFSKAKQANKSLIALAKEGVAALGESYLLGEETQKNFEYLGFSSLSTLKKEMKESREALEKMTIEARDGTHTSKELSEARERATKAEASYNKALGESNKASAEASRASKERTDALHAETKALGDAALAQMERDRIEAQWRVRLMTDMRHSSLMKVEGLADLPSLMDILGAPEQNIDPVIGKMMQLANISQDTAESFAAVGDSIASALGGAAAEGVDLLFERIATGTKATKGAFAGIIGEFLRNTGTQLIADGVKSELMGLSQTFLGLPTGPALLAHGGIEIAAGLAMGGAGALAQRRDKSGDGASSTGGSGSASSAAGNVNRASDPGPTALAPIVVNFNSAIPASQREAQEIGNTISQYLSQRTRGPR